jgi:hypothetical protein
VAPPGHSGAFEAFSAIASKIERRCGALPRST